MKYIVGFVCCFCLMACSSTTYRGQELLAGVDKERLSSVSIFISSEQMVLASQANERLFKLHHNAAQVHEMVSNLARVFGFQLRPEAEAEYRLNLLAAKPDGGECLQGLSTVGKGFTYTMSVLTLGVVPATNGYCLQVDAELFYRQEIFGELSKELSFLAEFSVNEGRVSVLASANEVDNYQRVVTIEDEARALETSISALFKTMIEKGAFD